MPCIEILGSGRLDSRNSAFPAAVQLSNGDVLCSFSVGGGPDVTGGTDWARSSDGGETWVLEGTILEPAGGTTNALKLSVADDGTLYAYGSRSSRTAEQTFGEGRNEAVFSVSTDNGHTWSPPRQVPMSQDCPFEISHGILPLATGRLLAPAATLPAKDRLGEEVVVAISDDGGNTWPAYSVVFKDPEGKLGFFEQKLARIGGARVLAVCWTVTLGDVVDRADSYTISCDDGSTWLPARTTGICGQTMTPIHLGSDRLLVLYNRRYGQQGIVMNLVTFTDEAWSIHFEGLLYDAKASRQRPEAITTGVEEFDTFAFGFPTAIRLQDGNHLTTHWCKEGASFGIRWTKLRIDW